VKHASAAAAASPHGSSGGSSAPGVKPGNSTGHWTHCTTGGSAGNATCSGNGPKADGSKRYGNGKTAAQIAVSRGGVGVQLTGPGNSQPHKATACGYPDNKSGGVDVHAIKSYDSAACAPQSSQQAALTPALATLLASSGAPSGSLAGNTSSPAAVPATAAGTRGAAGGVLGAQATLRKQGDSRGAGGVAGAFASLGKVAAKGTLPFTGLPLWIAVILGLGLIAGGLAFRAEHPARP
jgi:hypothetical protein